MTGLRTHSTRARAGTSLDGVRWGRPRIWVTLVVTSSLTLASTAPAPAAEAPGPTEILPRISPLCIPALRALRVVGCTLLKEDTATTSDPLPAWGGIDCRPSRHRHLTTGGDWHRTAGGEAQWGGGFRRLTVIDGDDVDGERCELGRNEHRPRFSPERFNLYREGQRRVTFLSLRLPAGFPLGTDRWQVVTQMKQTQPADNGGGTPVLALHAYRGSWELRRSNSAGPSGDTTALWSTRAATGVWTRFAFDVTYSRHDTGSVKLYVDLNGDGHAIGADEESPVISTYTLKRETPAQQSPDNDPLRSGDSLPSHLRAGIYHDPAIACPVAQGCAVELDNVQVYAVP